MFELPVPQPCKEVQPLVIRANVGDTVQINFKNKLGRRASIHEEGLSYNVLNSDGALIKTTEQDMTGEEGGHGAPDHEDTGEKGYNYRSERFFNRLKRVPIISKVFDSKTHGDPATPVFRSYVGERVIIRLLMPADKQRNISFVLHGHRWRAQPDDPFSRNIPVQGAISVGNVFNIEPQRTDCPGDYLYRSGSLRWDVESGMWGILRVSSRNIRCRCESVCRSVKQWWEKKWYEK